MTGYHDDVTALADDGWEIAEMTPVPQKGSVVRGTVLPLLSDD